jgi:hypothetical protein
MLPKQSYARIVHRLLHLLVVASPFVLWARGPASTSPLTRTVVLRGRITDTSGRAIPGATVAAIAQDGHVKSCVTDRAGRYAVNGLEPGNYVVWAGAKGYALYDNSGVGIGNSSVQNLDINLLPELEKRPAGLIEIAGGSTRLTRRAEHP